MQWEVGVELARVDLALAWVAGLALRLGMVLVDMVGKVVEVVGVREVVGHVV